MSAVGELTKLVEDKVANLLPSYRPLPFVYDIEINDKLADKNFGVRVGSASSTSGVNKYVTIDHNFEVILLQKHMPKKSTGDKDLRDKINAISGDMELIYKELYRRAGNIDSASLINIAPLDLSEPLIENDNITITLTLSIKYRVPT
jgi:hypothetical protein